MEFVAHFNSETNKDRQKGGGNKLKAYNLKVWVSSAKVVLGGDKFQMMGYGINLSNIFSTSSVKKRLDRISLFD